MQFIHSAVAVAAADLSRELLYYRKRAADREGKFSLRNPIN